VAVYMVQCKYQQARTWLVDCESEEQARAFYESGDLEMNGEPAMSHETGNLQAIVKMEGAVSKGMSERVIELPLGWKPEEPAQE
jgi:hypothetical protein